MLRNRDAQGHAENKAAATKRLSVEAGRTEQRELEQRLRRMKLASVQHHPTTFSELVASATLPGTEPYERRWRLARVLIVARKACKPAHSIALRKAMV